MSLRPEMSLMGGLATGALVYSTFQIVMPNATDLKQVTEFNTDVERSRKTATIISFGLVGGISLIAKDRGIFIVGGMIAIGLSFLYAHADAVSPLTGKVAMGIRGGLSTVPGAVTGTEPAEAGVIYVDENVA
jgi:hypothetical protein